MAEALRQFLPYLLNQAAEAASREFQAYYKARYAMLRTEWRVLFHIGLYGRLTASQIGEMSAMHKTKVSRAVAALEAKRFVRRQADGSDRRKEWLTLTAQGADAFADLSRAAQVFEGDILAGWSGEEVAHLKSSLQRLADLPTGPA